MEDNKTFCPITKETCREDCAWMVLDSKRSFTCAIQVVCDMANAITEGYEEQ